MSPVSIRLKKYGHLTKVYIEEKEVYQTAVTPKYEKIHIEALLRALVVENIIVEIDE